MNNNKYESAWVNRGQTKKKSSSFWSKAKEYGTKAVQIGKTVVQKTAPYARSAKEGLKTFHSNASSTLSDSPRTNKTQKPTTNKFYKRNVETNFGGPFGGGLNLGGIGLNTPPKKPTIKKRKTSSKNNYVIIKGKAYKMG